MQTCPSWVLQIKIALGTLATKYLICLNDSDPWRALYHHTKLLSAPVTVVNVGSPCTFDSKEYFCRSFKMLLVGWEEEGGILLQCCYCGRQVCDFTLSSVKKDRFSPFSPTHAIKCYSESVKLDPLIFAVCG